MHPRCKHYRRTVPARFRQGEHHFSHCGRSQSTPVSNLEQDRSGKDGTVLGATLGALGAATAALTPLGGLVIGALVGSAFNGSDRQACHRCSHSAYLNDNRGHRGDRMHHCSNPRCGAFVLAR